MDITRNRLIIGCVCIAILIAGLVTYLIVLNRGESEIQIEDFASENIVQEEKSTATNTSEDSESASTEMGKTVEESEKEMKENEVETEASIVENDTNDTEDSNSDTKSEETSSNIVPNTETEQKEEKENKEPEFCAPVKGEIIREFASESLVYSNTLQEWITHNGIDIKADKTSVVTSAAKGTVYAIKNDPRYGLTVIVNHDGGYQTIYSNLLTAEFVVEGEEVETGQTIGTVGNSASFEISDDYHLHFEILKNNKYIDPTTCIR